MKKTLGHSLLSLLGILAAAGFGFVMHRACAADSSAMAAGDGPLKVLKQYDAGPAGRWDYIAVDSAAHRLYASHATSVIVLDADNGTTIGEIADTPGVHGIAIAPEQGIGFTSNGKENMLSVFDTKTLKTLKKIKVGAGPDSIIYDPASKKIIAFNHKGGTISMIDPAALEQEPVTIEVGGTLEEGASDGAGHVFVNVEDKAEIVEIDSKAGKVLAHWPLAPGEGPTGLAIDREHHRLYAGCDNNLMMVVDAESGKVLGSAAIGSGVDGAGFDPKSGLAMSANGKDGTMSVVAEKPAGTFAAIQTLKTAVGARTMIVDPQTSLAYLPCLAESNGVKRFTVLVVGPVGP